MQFWRRYRREDGGWGENVNSVELKEIKEKEIRKCIERVEIESMPLCSTVWSEILEGFLKENYSSELMASVSTLLICIFSFIEI